jgi:hypothetical protein
MSDNKSDVERFYDAVAAKFGVQRKYHELHPVEQMQLVQAINMILQVVHD